jgi:hypothetical protein
MSGSEIKAERCKGTVKLSIVRFLLCIPSGNGAAHDDRLDLTCPLSCIQSMC